MAEKIVIALGGNALQSGKSEATAEAQLEVVKKTCEYIADISCKGYEIGLVHGNGPQVGRILLASETAKDVTPAMPFDVCGAMSQGYIGYHLQQALKYALSKKGRNLPVLTVATQMVVEKSDKANRTILFRSRSKSFRSRKRIHNEGRRRQRLQKSSSFPTS